MKELLIGLGCILGVIFGAFLLVFICGIVAIFLSNLFSSTVYISYNWDDIMHEGSRGIIISFLVCLLLGLAYLCGSVIMMK